MSKNTISAVDLENLYNASGETLEETWDVSYSDNFNRYVLRSARNKLRTGLSFSFYKVPPCTALTTMEDVQSVLEPLGYTIDSVTYDEPTRLVTIVFSF